LLVAASRQQLAEQQRLEPQPSFRPTPIPGDRGFDDVSIDDLQFGGGVLPPTLTEDELQELLLLQRAR